jgi:hypothetical protein
MKQYKLAEGLDAAKKHTVQVFKVTEDNWDGKLKSTFTFGGLRLDSGGFDLAPRASSRRLEFIGDSDTAGWCADGSPDDSGKGKYEDAYVTWAQQIARSFGADPMVEAVSGWGVTKASTPIQTVLNNYGSFNPDLTWNYSTWTPDAIVLLIGPNDESDKSTLTDLNITGQGFIKQYTGLLDMLVENYKSATVPPKIIHVCGGSGNGLDPCGDIQKANAQFNKMQPASGMKGYYTSITKANWKLINGPNGKGTSKYNGCDSHYSSKGHEVLAGDILPQIQKVMGWTTVGDAVVV